MGNKSLLHNCVQMNKNLTKQSLREKCPNTGKYRPEKTPYLDTFHIVNLMNLFLKFNKNLSLQQLPFISRNGTKFFNTAQKIKFSIKDYFVSVIKSSVFLHACHYGSGNDVSCMLALGLLYCLVF